MIQGNKIENDFYTAELVKDEWVFKSKQIDLKSDGKYKDVPRYPLIYEYENSFKNSYNLSLSEMVKSIGKKLLTYTKKQE